MRGRRSWEPSLQSRARVGNRKGGRLCDPHVSSTQASWHAGRAKPSTEIPGSPFSGEYKGQNRIFPQENPPMGQRWWHRGEVTRLCLGKRLQRGNRNTTCWRCGSRQPRGETSQDTVLGRFAMFRVKKSLKKTPDFQQNSGSRRGKNPAATFPGCNHQFGTLAGALG